MFLPRFLLCLGKAVVGFSGKVLYWRYNSDKYLLACDNNNVSLAAVVDYGCLLYGYICKGMYQFFNT